jgi:hypothetical protein
MKDQLLQMYLTHKTKEPFNSVLMVNEQFIVWFNGGANTVVT